ncbi:MAG: sigma-70 family RNA polymerase sigma factor [Bacteroidales bacterium]|nr:sigma-70 family RNA polymerase sigma factor [Bacteroidales bacterium]MBN2632539.1 sigma-70 family RNA polymerase sigma factor [Bacteroidales bacterium]
MFLRFSGKKSKNRTEEELINEFSSTGDTELLGELYSDYMHLVYGVCLKYLSDRDASMDAVMQIFEKLITEIPKQKIDNFRSWLYVVAKNYCLMQIRAGKAGEKRFKEWALDPGNFMENDTYLHPVDREDNETDMALADCIERLKAEQKQCIRQFYYEDRCYSEIAQNLDIDEKKVKSYLQNGKRNLKLCLEEKNEKKRQ